MLSNEKVNNERVINITGIKVALGPLCRELNELYNKWNNDFYINRTTAVARPVTLEEQSDAYNQYIKDRSYVLFTIYDKDNMKPIGMSYLSNIEKTNAEFGIVIGESEYHGKGYGTEATELTLDYAFTVLGLHNVMLIVYEYNIAGIKAYEKAGFREFGRRKEAKWMGGKLWDTVYMEYLSNDYKSKVLRNIFKFDS